MKLRFLIFISLGIQLLLLGTVYYDIYLPVKIDPPAISVIQPAKNSLLMNCKQVDVNTKRCRNEELICYDFKLWGKCFILKLAGKIK